MKHTDDDLRALLGTTDGRPLSDLTDLLSEMRGEGLQYPTPAALLAAVQARRAAELGELRKYLSRRQVTSTGPMTSVRLSLRE